MNRSPMGPFEVEEMMGKEVYTFFPFFCDPSMNWRLAPTFKEEKNPTGSPIHILHNPKAGQMQLF